MKGTTGDDENERLEQDERYVKKLMGQSRSGEAIEYLQQTLTNKYPTDANVQFGYATLLQELAVAVNNEGMVAAYSFDLAKAAAATGVSSRTSFSGNMNFRHSPFQSRFQRYT